METFGGDRIGEIVVTISFIIKFTDLHMLQSKFYSKKGTSWGLFSSLFSDFTKAVS